jgi:hypothetical protein
VGQLLRIILGIKCCILNSIISKLDAQESMVVSIAIDHQMVVIQVQVINNFIEDVLLDGGYGINIITKKLRVQLGLSKPNLAPYNLHMTN